MTGWSWDTARDAVEVHRLLCDSDARNAQPGAPVPSRRIETTERHVRTGSVHVLRHGEQLVGMFTLTPSPPHGMNEEVFPAATRPAYLQRLAVRGEWGGGEALVGVRCVRRACEVAREGGADVLRAEVNPDLREVRALLDTLGFEQFGPTLRTGGRAVAFLQRAL